MFLMRYEVWLRAFLVAALVLSPSIWIFRMVHMQIGTLTRQQYNDLCDPDVFIPFEKRYNIRILLTLLFLIIFFTGFFMLIFYLSDIVHSFLIANISFYYAEYGAPFSPHPISTDISTYITSIIIRSLIMSVPFAYALLFLVARYIFKSRFHLILFPYMKYDRHLQHIRTKKEILDEPKIYPYICLIISFVLFIVCLISSCFSYFTADSIVFKYGIGPTIYTYEYSQLIEMHHFTGVARANDETLPIDGCFFLMSDGKAFFLPQLPDSIRKKVRQHAPAIHYTHHYLFDVNNPPFKEFYFPSVDPFSDFNK